MQLQNKVAIVTGAGAGVGRAIAQLFAQEGAKVVACDLNGDNVRAVVEDIVAAGGHALALTTDVSKEEDIQALFRQTLETWGTLDILVNNAGIMDNFVPIAELTDELWDRILSVNLSSQMRAMRAAVKIFQEKEQGVIINLTSAAGLFGSRAGVAYTASKHAVVGMTKNVAFQYAQHGIRCNAIAPGGVETNIGTTMNAPSSFGSERVMSGAGNAPRTGQSEEVAAVALFLASDAASLVNGTVITADAGWMAY